MSEISEELLEELYTWIDEIPLTRPKRDLKRDFSDGVLVAEVVKHFHPHLVELHNYAPALAVSKKTINWHMLNRKVFKKLGFELGDDVINNLTSCKPSAMEQFLLMLKERLTPNSNYSSSVNVNNRVLPPQGNSVAHQQPIASHVIMHNSANDKASPMYGQLSPVGSITYLSDTSPRQQRQTGLQNSGFTAKLAAPAAKTNIPVARKEPAANQNSHPSIMAQNQVNHGSSGDVVPKALLEEKLQELLAKDELIQNLQGKVRRLEHLLQLKDIRIEDLQTRLGQPHDTSPQQQPYYQDKLPSPVHSRTSSLQVKRPARK